MNELTRAIMDIIYRPIMLKKNLFHMSKESNLLLLVHIMIDLLPKSLIGGDDFNIFFDFLLF